MNDPSGNPDRARPRAAADLHRRRVMDPADAMVNHILDAACQGDVAKARAALREASRRDPGFAERYERTARVLALLKDGEEDHAQETCPDLAAGILARMERQRLAVSATRRPAFGRGRSAIASAGLAFMAVLGVMQFRTVGESRSAAFEADTDAPPPAVLAGAARPGPLQNLLAEAVELGWSLPPNAAGYEGLSSRERMPPLNSPTARRPGDRLEVFMGVASWRLAPRAGGGMSAGLMGRAEPEAAIEANLRRALDR